MTIKTVADFDKKLKAYQSATKRAMNAARECSNFALTHFEKCGDLGPIQRFYDAMVANYSRQPAFRAWIEAHSPAILNEGRQFTKDKSKTAQTFRVQDALAIPFWDFKPELGMIDFTAEDIKNAILQVLKRFEGKKYRPHDDAVVVELEAYKQKLGVS